MQICQKRIWESAGGKPGEYDHEIYKKFGIEVGWYVKKKNDWKNYKYLTFSLNAPGGHLPARGLWVVVAFVFFGVGLGGDLFSRVSTCKL